jgi:hypothetical protein
MSAAHAWLTAALLAFAQLGCAMGALEIAPAASAAAGAPTVTRGGRPLPAGRGTLLQKGDVITTPEGARAGIAFGGSAEALLLENTSVTLGSIWVWFGSLLSYGQTPPVHTEVLTVEDLETVYLVEVPPCAAPGGHCPATVTVLQGHVLVSPPPGETWPAFRLAELDQATMSSGGNLTMAHIDDATRLRLLRKGQQLRASLCGEEGEACAAARRWQLAPTRDAKAGPFVASLQTGVLFCDRSRSLALGGELGVAVTPDRNLYVVLGGEGEVAPHSTVRGLVQAGLRYDVPFGSSGLYLTPALVGGWSGWTRKAAPLATLGVVSPELGLKYAVGPRFSVGFAARGSVFFSALGAGVAVTPTLRLGTHF